MASSAEYARAYRARMTEEQRAEYLRKARKRNAKRPRSAVNASRSEWARRYPERERRRRRIAESARRARKLNQFIEHIDPDVVLQRDNGVCGICQQAIVGDFHVDHVVPLARGGEHSYSNVQLAHPRCNEVKGCRTVA